MSQMSDPMRFSGGPWHRQDHPVELHPDGTLPAEWVVMESRPMEAEDLVSFLTNPTDTQSTRVLHRYLLDVGADWYVYVGSEER